MDVWTVARGFSKYEVNKSGKIRNAKTKRELSMKPQPDNYVKISIYDDDYKCKRIALHILIALTFIPNPMNKLTVNHKNKIRNDNSVKNLEWSTHAQQSNHKMIGREKIMMKGHAVWQCDIHTHERIKLFISANEAARQVSNNKKANGGKINMVASQKKDSKGYLRKSYHGYWWQYADNVTQNLENEIWVKLSCIETRNDYQISNYGRIKGVYSTIFNELYDDYGYKVCGIESVSYKVHLLVAKTFLLNPNDYPIVNHIDGNKNNSHVDNLEWTTYSLNSIHAGENNLTKSPVREVEAFDIDGKLYGKWRTMHAAKKDTGTCVQEISKVCKGTNGKHVRQYSNGYYWKYADSDKLILGIKAYNLEDKLCGQWLNVNTAAKDLSCSVGQINNVCNGSRKSINNIYIVKREQLKLGEKIGLNLNIY